MHLLIALKWCWCVLKSTSLQLVEFLQCRKQSKTRIKSSSDVTKMITHLKVLSYIRILSKCRSMNLPLRSADLPSASCCPPCLSCVQSNFNFFYCTRSQNKMEIHFYLTLSGFFPSFISTAIQNSSSLKTKLR